MRSADNFPCCMKEIYLCFKFGQKQNFPVEDKTQTKCTFQWFLMRPAVNENMRFILLHAPIWRYIFSLSAHPLEVSLRPDMSFIPVERGSSMILSCNSSGCPHAHITWQNVKHQSLLDRIDTQALVSQLGPWTIGLEDNRTFICEVECGSVVKSKQTRLKVFCKYDSSIAYNNCIFVLILSICCGQKLKRAKLACTHREGGRAYSLSPINYSDPSQSWVSVTSCMWKWAARAFLLVLPVMLNG